MEAATRPSTARGVRKRVDLGRAHLGGMALAVEEDEAPDPGDVGLLGAAAVVACAQGLAHAVEQTGLGGVGRPGFPDREGREALGTGGVLRPAERRRRVHTSSLPSLWRGDYSVRGWHRQATGACIDSETLASYLVWSIIAAEAAGMRITTLETYLLSVPLPQPVRTSTSTISRVSELIVRLTTDAGLVGIGEAHGPFLSQAGPEGMRAVGQILERVTPLVVGQDPFAVERIWQDLFSLTYTSVRGIPTLAQQRRQLVTAMSAIDIALWDLMGKATGRPVHALLGGALRDRVPAYVTGFYYRDGERPDDLRREAALYLEQGYRTVKVKVAGVPPEADAERVASSGRPRRGRGHDARRKPGLGPADRDSRNQALRAPRHLLARGPDAMVRRAPRAPPLEGGGRHADRRRRDGVHALRPAHDGGRGARRLPDHRLDVGGRPHDLAKAAVMAELYQVPLAAHHDPQIHVHAVAASPTGFILESFADPTRDPLWFELFRERPKIVDGVMAVPDAPGTGARAAPGHPREIRRQARLTDRDRVATHRSSVPTPSTGGV